MKKATPQPAAEFRPSASLIKRARSLMANYAYVIEHDGDGGYFGSTAELPGVIVDGDTADECVRNLEFGLETVIASYLAEGKTPPPAAGREKRTEQVNVRFTRSERNRLQQESARQGFRGVGDLIRAEMIRQLGVAAH